MPLISLLDRSKRWDILFKFDNKDKKWFLEFSEHKKVKKHENEGIRRHIYIRGSSYATTIPLPVMLGKDLAKQPHAHFEFDPKQNHWIVEVNDE